MICPVCSNKAISFSRFLLMVYPRHLTCRSCRAELTWSAKWGRVFHWSIIACVVSAIALSIVSHAVGISIAIYLAAVLVVVLVFDTVFWRSSTYEKAR